jgi:hypothetical protein
MQRMLKCDLNVDVGYVPTGYISDLVTSHKDTNKKCNCGVYEICKCQKKYIGDTGRELPVRVKEHQTACVKLQAQKLAIAEHVCLNISNNDHEILWSESKVVAKEDHKAVRRFKEAIIINHHNAEDLLNRRDEMGTKIHTLWKNMSFKFWKE